MESNKKKQGGKTINPRSIKNQNSKNNEKGVHEVPKIQSQYTEKYNDYMRDIPQLKIQSYIHILAQNNIQYHPGRFTKEMNVSIGDERKQGRIIYLIIKLSYFIFRIQVYNHHQSSEIAYYLESLGSGSIGKIYKYSYMNIESFAVKNIAFEKKKGKIFVKKGICFALQEYCIYKLASCLKIGPKVEPKFGFDLIIFKDSIQFALQRCQRIIISHKNITEMKTSLKLLHDLKIVHGDIKGENIMFSPSYQKCVFIDFNCSSIIEQPIGFKTLTSFVGTPGHTYSELQDIFRLPISRPVDLYYNDIYAFQIVTRISLQQVSVDLQKKQQQYKSVSIIDSAFFCLYMHIKLRFLFFEYNSQILESFIQENKSVLTINKQLKKKLKNSKEDEEEDEKQIRAQIIQIINETVLVCREISLNYNARKGEQIIFNTFKDSVYTFYGNQLTQAKAKITKEKRLANFKFQKSPSDNGTIQPYQNLNVLYVLFDQFFPEKCISRTSEILQQMKSELVNQENFIKLYGELIKKHASKSILQESVDLFQKKSYVIFQSQNLIQRMLAIDEKYEVRRGKKKFTFTKSPTIFNMREEVGKSSICYKKHQIQQNRLGEKSFFNLKNLSRYLKYLQQSQHDQNQIRCVKQLLVSLEQIFEEPNQTVFQKIIEFDKKSKQQIGSNISENIIRFIVNLLKYIFILPKSPIYMSKQQKKLQIILLKLMKTWRIQGELQTYLNKGYHIYCDQHGSEIFSDLSMMVQDNQLHEYYNFQKVQQSKIIQHLEYNKPILQNVCELYKALKQFTHCQHCFFVILDQILYTTVINLPLVRKRNKQFLKLLLEDGQQYYCTIDTRLLKDPSVRFVVKKINVNYFQCISGSYPQKSQAYLAVLEEWFNSCKQEKDEEYFHFKQKKIQLYFKGKKYQQCLKLINSALKQIDVKREYFIPLFFTHLYKCKFALTGKYEIIPEYDNFINSLNFSLNLDDMIERIFFYYIQYLLKMREFEKLFQCWKQTINWSPIPPSMGIRIYFFIHQMTLIYLNADSSTVLQFVIAYHKVVLNNLQKYGFEMIPFQMLVITMIFYLRNQFSRAIDAHLLYYLRSSILFISLHIYKCPITISQRVQEKIIPIILWMHEIQQNKQILMTSQIPRDEQIFRIYFKNIQKILLKGKVNFLSYLIKQKVDLRNFRKSLERQRGSFDGSYIRQLLVPKKKFTKIFIRSKVIEKFKKFLKIKKEPVKLGYMKGVYGSCIYSFEKYLNFQLFKRPN